MPVPASAPHEFPDTVHELTIERDNGVNGGHSDAVEQAQSVTPRIGIVMATGIWNERIWNSQLYVFPKDAKA